jgi:hypothetical protein
MAIFEIFYQPGKLFETLPERRNAWILPLILGVLLLVATSFAAIHFIGMETILRQQLANTRVTPEQLQTVLTQANSPGRIYTTYIATSAGGVVSILLIAGLLTVFAMVGSKQARFGTNFSMVAIAMFPYRLVICLTTVLVMATTPDPTSLEVTNLLATNVGAFMNKETMSKGLYTLLSQLDILTFAEIGLLSWGFAKVNKTSVSFGLFAVLTLWIIYVLTRMGLSLLF